MKKFLALTLVVLLAFCSVLPMFAAEKTMSNAFDKLPANFKNPTSIKLAALWKDGATNAMHNTRGDFDYIYLKNKGLGNFVVEFEVKEAGIYEFGFMLMGYKKGVPRTTNVQIDKGDVYRMEYDYTDADDNKKHYFYGIKQELSAGKHTMTLSLTSDFDDSKVKSLYIQDFFYEKTGDIKAETTKTEVVPSSPATFDAGVLAVVCAGVSLAGAVVCRKKK